MTISRLATEIIRALAKYGDMPILDGGRPGYSLSSIRISQPSGPGAAVRIELEFEAD